MGENLKIRIPFLNEFQVVEIADKNVCGILHPNKVETGNEVECVASSLKTPLNSEEIVKFLKNLNKLVIVVNDRTRPTPTSKILDILHPYIVKAEPQIVIATGAHRAPTEPEYREILGKYYESYRKRTLHHDDKDSESLAYFGKSRLTRDIYINKTVLEANGIITIGSVEPHYFAGFTGGRKSIIPGVVDYETIEQNHFHALSKEACPMKLQGNPVHEDLETTMRKICGEKDVFAINVVTDRNRKIYSCASGHIIDSFYPLIKPAKEVYNVRIEEKADIVVTIAQPPLDLDLYQSQKAIENAKQVVKADGIIILVSGCFEGIGPRAFFDLLSIASSPEQIYDKIRERYRLGYHKSAKMVETIMMAKLWGVTSLPEEVSRKALIEPFADVQRAIDSALKEKGKDAKVLFIMDGGMTVPTIGTKD
ncbi:MAG: nickel-dependent lactate racemase [Candidatus Hodarchaeota archaeon]